jgi:hypothetical protein
MGGALDRLKAEFPDLQAVRGLRWILARVILRDALTPLPAVGATRPVNPGASGCPAERAHR